jgi:low affinity Fe/Cu permease
MGQKFAHLAQRVAILAGHYQSFLIALLIIAIWAASGPLFGFSDTWQLVINTGTTIVTFLMVFLIQNTQNRDGLAMQLKLDELIRATEAADNSIIRAEDETDEELAQLKKQYEALFDEHTELKTRLGQTMANGLAAGLEQARDVPHGWGEPGESGTASS